MTALLDAIRLLPGEVDALAGQRALREAQQAAKADLEARRTPLLRGVPVRCLFRPGETMGAHLHELRLSHRAELRIPAEISRRGEHGMEPAIPVPCDIWRWS